MKKIVSIIAFVLIASTLFAQSHTTEGTEFWLTFMSNYTRQTNDKALQLKLIISAREQTSVTVANPNTAWSKTVSVTANNISEVVIPNQHCYTLEAEKVSKTGIYVKADKPISLYASNYSDASYDATNVLPLNVLTGSYVIQTYEVSREEAGYAKEFAVIATDNNTLLEITTHARTTTGKLKNSPFTVTLNKGEVYQVMSVDDNNNLSGSTIHASKPVAVFSGNQCANVPSGCDWCDHIVEQAMPTSLWGRQFAITAALQQTENRIMITAQTAGTEVRINGVLKKTLEQYQSYEYIMGADEWSCFIETSYPAACYLYIEGGKNHKGMGDPSSVHISPFEQKIDKMTFSTFATSRSQWHYVNIVTTANAKAGMQLDGRDIHAYFTALDGNNNLVYARIKVDHGTHTLTNDIDGFTAWVYGLGTSESYAYTAGSAAIPLDAQILVDSRPSNETEMRSFCYQHPFTFKPQVNIDYTDVKWDFGDGKSAATPTAKHQYNSIGDYTVSMTVSNSEETQTISTVLHLVNTQKDTTFAIICEGEEYVFNGKKYNQKGFYPITLKSKDGCDSVAVLALDVVQSYLFTENKHVARGQTFHWRGGRYTAGTYYDSLLTVYGCDSVYKLVLTEVDAPATQKDTICYEPTYLFMGHEYPLPSVENHLNDKYIPYRLKYYDEDACLTYIMDLAIVPSQEQTIEIYDTISAGTAYNFHGKSLTSTDTYTYEQPLGCNGSYIEILHLVVMPYPIVETNFTLCKTTDNIKFYGRTIESAGEYYDTVYTDIGLGEIRHLIVTDNKTYGEISVSDVNSYIINGQTYSESGTYTQILKNVAGCDSILTINVGINGKCEVTEEVSAILCEGKTLKWNGQTISKAGDYKSDVMISSNGCDSIAILHVEIPEKDTTLIEKSICEGDFVRYNDEIITTAGNHYYIFTSSKGCDSVVNVHVKINESYFIPDPHTIIEGKDIVWEGETYTGQGYYTKEFVATNGCDSIRELQLTVIEQPKEYQHAIYLNTSKAWSNYAYFSVYYWDDYSSGYVSMQQLNCDENMYFAVLPYGEWENVIFRCHNSYAGNATNTWGSAVMQTADLKYSQDKPLFNINTNNNYATGHWTEMEIQDNCELCINSTKTLVAPIAGDLYVWDNGEITTTRTVTVDKAGKQTYTCKVYNIDPTVKDNLMPNGDFETVPADTTKFVAFYSEYKNYGFQPNFRYAIYQPYWTPTFDPMNTFAVVCNRITFIDQPTFNIMPHGNYGLYIDGGMDKNVSMAWQAKSADYPDLKIIKDSLYVFSYFVLGGGYENPAVLQFRLSYKNDNGTYTQLDLGEPYTTVGHGVLAGITNKDWVQKKIIFKAPVTSSDISIQLYDLTFAPLGNDFILDDICFNLVTEKNKSLVSEHTIELQVNDITYGDVNAAIFEGQSYTFLGKTYNKSNDYPITLKGQNQYGCDSIVTLHLTVTDKPIRSRTIDAAICDGDSYDFYGETLNEPKTGYTHKIEYAEYDSVITLNLKVNPVYNDPVQYETIMQGESFTWNGRTFTEPVEMTIDSVSQFGCDSVVTLHLTVTDKPVRNRTIDAAICDGDSYDFYGETLSEPKTGYTHKIEYAEYDSVITLNLKVNPVYNDPVQYETIMQGESFTWNGRTFTESVEMTIDSVSQFGCDSIISLKLTVTDKPIRNRTIDAAICDGGSYDFYGETLNEPQTGYTHKIEYAEYDSVITLNLRVNPVYNDPVQYETIMQGESFTWNGRTFTEPVELTIDSVSQFGCDSVVTLHLTVTDKPIRSRTIDAAICDGGSYDFYGETLSEPKTGYTHKIEYAEYDSVITLNLRVNPVYNDPVQYETIMQGESFTWNGRTFTESVELTIDSVSQFGCDSIISLKLTVTDKPIRNRTINAAICDGGSYDFYGETLNEPQTGYTHKIEYAEYDSVITLNLRVNPVYNDPVQYETIMQGESFTWNGRTFTEPVELTIDSVSQFGCDSIISLKLTVNEKPKEVRTQSSEVAICEGEHYDFFGTTLSNPGTYTHEAEYDDYIQIDELTLTVNPRYQRDTTVTIIQGETYQWGEQRLTQTGYYPLNLKTIHGCDSTIILFLRIQQKTYGRIDRNVTICEGDSYDFYGTQLTQSGTYTHLISTATADTAVTLRLTVEKPTTTYVEYVLPDGEYYSIGNHLYSFPGDYEVVLKSAHGCDSIINLHLETASSQRIDNADIYIGNPPCADDGIVTLHINYDNKPDSIKLTFSGRDNAKGFTAQTITDISDDIIIQHQARAGEYKVEAGLYKKGKIVKTVKQNFTLMYPSAVIEQRWNDALVVLTAKYNGGYDFKKFQWYKNGEKLEGESGSYLYQPLEMGASYSAMLTETNGIVLMSCPLIAEPHQDITLYPTHYRPGQRATCRVSEDAMMYIYDSTGKMVMQQPLEEGESQQTMPQQQGLYIVNIVLTGSQHSRQFKIAVGN